MGFGAARPSRAAIIAAWRIRFRALLGCDPAPFRQADAFADRPCLDSVPLERQTKTAPGDAKLRGNRFEAQAGAVQRSGAGHVDLRARRQFYPVRAQHHHHPLRSDAESLCDLSHAAQIAVRFDHGLLGNRAGHQ
jgi:hypothetical protein